MIEGSCHCGAVRWRFDADLDGATICNCTVCRRYGVLWAYGHEGEGIDVSGTTRPCVRGKSVEFHFARRAVVSRSGARNVPTSRAEGASPSTFDSPSRRVAWIPVDRFDGLGTFEGLPLPAYLIAEHVITDAADRAAQVVHERSRHDVRPRGRVMPCAHDVRVAARFR